MVGVPGRFRGCNTCHTRRVRCDNQRPSCRKCIDTGRECAGYERENIIFLKPTNNTSSSKMDFEESPPYQAPQVNIIGLSLPRDSDVRKIGDLDPDIDIYMQHGGQANLKSEPAGTGSDEQEVTRVPPATEWAQQTPTKLHALPPASRDTVGYRLSVLTTSSQSSTSTRTSTFSTATSRTSMSSFDPSPSLPEFDVDLPNLPTSAVGPGSTSGRAYYCSFCDTKFARKFDWKRHEDEFHEVYKKYPCPDCHRVFCGSGSFKRHHEQAHSCIACPHASRVVQYTRRKTAWACGFCAAFLPSRDRYFDHVARHYEAGVTKAHWSHSNVIYGLLHQKGVHGAWKELMSSLYGNLRQEDRPLLEWTVALTGRAPGYLTNEEPGKLQDLLEFFDHELNDPQAMALLAHSQANLCPRQINKTADGIQLSDYTTAGKPGAINCLGDTTSNYEPSSGSSSSSVHGDNLGHIAHCIDTRRGYHGSNEHKSSAKPSGHQIKVTMIAIARKGLPTIFIEASIREDFADSYIEKATATRFGLHIRQQPAPERQFLVAPGGRVHALEPLFAMFIGSISEIGLFDYGFSLQVAQSRLDDTLCPVIIGASTIERIANSASISRSIDSWLPSHLTKRLVISPKDDAMETKGYDHQNGPLTDSSGFTDQTSLPLSSPLPSSSESNTTADIAPDWRSQLLVNSIMKSLCRWLDSKIFISHGQVSSGSHSQENRSASSMAGGVEPSSQETDRSKPNSSKRSRKESEKEDDEDESRGKRPCGRTDPHEKENAGLRFACPYFKRNPRKYGRVTTCPGPGWVEIHRLKHHLHRRHALPPQCPRCCETFGSESLRDSHIRGDERCEKRDNVLPLDGFTKDQERQLRSKKKSSKNMTDADRWREIYRILFPDDDPATMPDPYHQEADLEQSAEMHGACNCEEFSTFARREFPGFVRRELDEILESDFPDAEEGFRTRLYDTLVRVQARFIGIYQNSTAEGTDESPAEEPVDTAISSGPTEDDFEFLPITVPAVQGSSSGSSASSSHDSDLGRLDLASEFSGLLAGADLFQFNFDWSSPLDLMFSEAAASCDLHTPLQQDGNEHSSG